MHQLSMLNLRFLVLLLLPLLNACGQQQTKIPKPSAVVITYEALKDSIESHRKQLSEAYAGAVSKKEKDSLIQSSREYVFNTIIIDLLPAWYGTPWSFYGMSTQPKCGSIACGYFVTTVLRDAGFDLPRIKWAQVPSETLITEITDKPNIKHLINTDISNVEAWVKASGKGIYIAGLDNHVGFIVNTGADLSFVHSNYYDPLTGVASQQLDSYNPLKNSRYRVVGKILNDEMMRRWLTNEKLGV